MFARTKRLTLRPGWPEDAPALAEAIGHESVVTMLSRVPWPYTLTDAQEFLARPRQRSDAWFLILAHDGDHPRPIGGIGLHRETDRHELGYWLTEDAWGRGYATEAGRAVIDIARYALGLKRLTARHFADNPASARVLHKLGFRETGHAVMHSIARGGDAPCLLLDHDLEAERRGAEGMSIAA